MAAKCQAPIVTPTTTTPTPPIVARVAEPVDNQVGMRIRGRREALGLNQRQLADLLDVPAITNQSVSNWERGRHIPSPQYLQLLAKVLHVEVAYFYVREAPSQPSSLNGGSQLDRIETLLTAVVSQLNVSAEGLQAAQQAVEELAEQPGGSRTGQALRGTEADSAATED